jgi:hypothetical protein
MSLITEVYDYARLGYGWEDLSVKFKISEGHARTVVEQTEKDRLNHIAAMKKAMAAGA